jgi:hypothetical protein
MVITFTFTHTTKWGDSADAVVEIEGRKIVGFTVDGVLVDGAVLLNPSQAPTVSFRLPKGHPSEDKLTPPDKRGLDLEFAERNWTIPSELYLQHEELKPRSFVYEVTTWNRTNPLRSAGKPIKSNDLQWMECLPDFIYEAANTNWDGHTKHFNREKNEWLDGPHPKRVRAAEQKEARVQA